MKSKTKRPRVVLTNRCIVLNKKGEVLVMQRSANHRFGELWEFPGGKLDEAQDVSQALEREVLEETGLVIVPVTRMAFVENQVLTQGPYKGLPFVCITGIGKTEGSEKVVLSEEHQAYKWVKKNGVFDYPLRIEAKKAFSALKNKLRR